MGYSSYGRKESDTTEETYTHMQWSWYVYACNGVGMCMRVSHCPQPVDAFLDLKRHCTFKEPPSPEAIPVNRDSRLLCSDNPPA